jgi:hypothetical protein
LLKPEMTEEQSNIPTTDQTEMCKETYEERW